MYSAQITATWIFLLVLLYFLIIETASLCAVSDVTITTKTKDDDISYTYSIDHEGNIADKKPCHLGKGVSFYLLSISYATVQNNATLMVVMECGL